ncbi:MAG: exodeoxyribonuclease VII large subunit, partial [Prevotella sp.]|nr:exodeoxyribonuclease VII large subunit [Prevotella sp.]
MREDRYTLRQLNLLVRDAVEMQLPDEYWVEAELSECRERGGHCYMELIEKDATTNTPVARASAKCWRQTWQMVQPYFERTTGQPLLAGLKFL